MATDAESAFAYLAVTLPDLLILDLNLPGRDGYEVLRAIRAKQRYDLMLVVLLSVRDDLEAKVKGLDLGAVEYLVKPVQSDELSARVRALDTAQAAAGQNPSRVQVPLRTFPHRSSYQRVQPPGARQAAQS